MTTTTAQAIITTSSVNPLLLSDRCDQCSAQALSVVTMQNGMELFFCRHHLHLNLDKLLDRALTVADYTSSLTTAA